MKSDHIHYIDSLFQTPSLPPLNRAKCLRQLLCCHNVNLPSIPEKMTHMCEGGGETENCKRQRCVVEQIPELAQAVVDRIFYYQQPCIAKIRELALASVDEIEAMDEPCSFLDIKMHPPRIPAVLSILLDMARQLYNTLTLKEDLCVI